MYYELDSHKLATVIRQQRAGRGLREVADELGDVSASSVCRLEAGKSPDMMVFLRVCRWLRVPPAEFFRSVAGSEEESSPATHAHGRIISLIRSDAELAPVTANVLTALVTAAYQIQPQP